MSRNTQPFIITFENKGSSIKSFENDSMLMDHVRRLAEKDELFPETGDFASLETIETLLNREAPLDTSGKKKIYSVYADMEDYISDMCTLQGIKQTVKELKTLNEWGFDLVGFFDAIEIQEYADEPEAEALDVAFLKRVCKI